MKKPEASAVQREAEEDRTRWIDDFVAFQGAQ